MTTRTEMFTPYAAAAAGAATLQAQLAAARELEAELGVGLSSTGTWRTRDVLALHQLQATLALVDALRDEEDRAARTVDFPSVVE